MTQIERIRYYEGLMEQAERARSAEEARETLRELEAYYTGPLWMEDFAADEAGLLPEGLKRGVLSEDGIDHLLDRFRTEPGDGSLPPFC